MISGVGVDVGLGPRGRLLCVADQSGNEPAVAGVDLQPVVTPVGHVNVTLRVHGYAGRPVQVAEVGGGGLETEQELALRVELLHPVVLPVGDVDGTRPVHADTPRQIELAVAVSVLAEAVQERAVLVNF